MAWDERNDDALRKAWADGLPVELIADSYGCSIGDVSLRVHQLRFVDRDHERRLLRTVVEPLFGRQVERVGPAALAEAAAILCIHRGVAAGAAAG